MHYKGEHSCAVQSQKVNRQEIVKYLKEHPPTRPKPNKIINEKIKQMMMTDNFQRDDADQLAKTLVDIRGIYVMLGRKKKEMCGDSFEAEVKYKANCDEKDRYLIYETNNRQMNGEPSCVFKSSPEMA